MGSVPVSFADSIEMCGGWVGQGDADSIGPTAKFGELVDQRLEQCWRKEPVVDPEHVSQFRRVQNSTSAWQSSFGLGKSQEISALLDFRGWMACRHFVTYNSHFGAKTVRIPCR
jgi:hypothetical protein